MSSLLVTDIGQLVTNDPGAGPNQLGILTDAAIIVNDGTVAWTGAAGNAPAADRMMSAEGRSVVPGFVDSHTHIVFGGDRSDEFEARMAGTSYAAGGIRSTVSATRAAGDEHLRSHAQQLIDEMADQGTTTVEIKSGYGLSLRDEERITRIAATLTDEVTYLGAHVVPAEYADDREAYVDLVVGEMLDACAPHSKWIDVFCETGAFTEPETRRILSAGAARGLGLRLHANQLTSGGGIRLAVELGAASVDHCTHFTSDDIAALASSATVATLLPGAEFSTRQPYPDARRLIDAGVTVAIATDCNPGSSFTSSMPFCIALAVREMGMTPAEALWAATAGGAAALRRSDIGWIGEGAHADFVELAADTHVHLAYRPGTPMVNRVWKSGELVRDFARQPHG